MRAATPSPAHTIWLQQQNAAFVYLPKVACTSWKLFLGRALELPHTNRITYANVHDGAALTLPYLIDHSPEEQQHFHEELNRAAITIYAVIREPRERALSAYLDKILWHQNPNSYFSQQVLPDLQAFHGLSGTDKPSFDQFLQWIQAGRSPHCHNDHWQPMSNLLGIDATAEGGQLPGHWRLWPMNAMTEAASTVAALLGYSGSFPGREALGERPNRDSSTQLNAYRNATVDQRLHEIYHDDLKLYSAVIQSQPNP